MGRLIDADAINKVDYSGLAYIAPDDYKGIADYFYKQLIVNQPTAFDVDKVIDQLEADRYIVGVNSSINDDTTADYIEGYNDMVNRSLAIVKGGGQG